MNKCCDHECKKQIMCHHMISVTYIGKTNDPDFPNSDDPKRMWHDYVCNECGKDFYSRFIMPGVSRIVKFLT